jgi:sugar phosphate isomerase/epimerase
LECGNASPLCLAAEPPSAAFIYGATIMTGFNNPRGTVTSRRVFLGQMTAATCAAALGQRLVPAAEDQAAWTMRLSTSSIHYLHLPIEQVCERIAKLGFEAVDIWSAHQGCPHLDDVAKRLGAAGLRQLLDQQKLKLFSFSVYAGGYERYAQLLGESGGGVAIRGSAGPCPPNALTAKMKAFLETLKPQLELCEKYNSYLAIENHGHALLNSLDSFKAFVDLNKSPRLGIALAPYHVQAGKESVEESIAICGGQLFYFYAWQHAGDVTQLPGHGPTDFRPWLAALAKVRYRGYVNPFMHGDLEPEAMSAALAKSRDYLLQCWAEVQKQNA